MSDDTQGPKRGSAQGLRVTCAELMDCAEALRAMRRDRRCAEALGATRSDRKTVSKGCAEALRATRRDLQRKLCEGTACDAQERTRNLRTT